MIFRIALFYLVVASAVSLAQPALSKLQKRLQELRSNYEAALSRQGDAVFAAARTALNDQYAAALHCATTEAAGAGRQADVKLLMEEKARLSQAGGQVDPAPPAKILEALRATYQSQLAKLQTAKEKAEGPIKAVYAKELTRMLAECGQEGVAEDVAAVRLALDALHTMGVDDGPVKTPFSDDANDRPIAARASGKDTPGAAENLVKWALASRSIIQTDRGPVGGVGGVTALPAGRVKIEGIQCTEPVARFPWHLLLSCPDLTVLNLQLKESLTPEIARLLGCLANLEELRLAGPLSVAALKALPRYSKLRALGLEQSGTEDLAAALPALARRCPLVTELSWRAAEGVKNEAFCAQITTWKSMEKLTLEGGQHTDAELRSLSQLRNLKRLEIHGSQLTDVALAAFRAAHPSCELVR